MSSETRDAGQTQVAMVERLTQAVATALYGEIPAPGSNSLTRAMQVPVIRRALTATLSAPPHGASWWTHTVKHTSISDAEEEIGFMREDWQKLGTALGFTEFVGPEVLIEKARELSAHDWQGAADAAEQWLKSTARKTGKHGVTAHDETLMRLGFIAGFNCAQPQMEGGLGAGGRYWRERAEFWRAQAVALGWREVRDAANGEEPQPASAPVGAEKFESRLRGRAGPFTAQPGERYVDADIALTVLREALAQQPRPDDGEPCRHCDGSGYFYSDPDLGPCNCRASRSAPDDVARLVDVDEAMVERALSAPYGRFAVSSFIPLKSPANLRAHMRAALTAALAPFIAAQRPRPASASVGVEALAKRIETHHWDVADKPVAVKFAAELRALAQQPADDVARLAEASPIMESAAEEYRAGAGFGWTWAGAYKAMIVAAQQEDDA